MEYNEKVNNLAPALVAIAPVLEKIGPVLKKLGKITQKVFAFTVKFGIGGVKQDRFLNRRDKIADLFINNGYYKGRKDGKTSVPMSKFKIVAADIPNAKNDSYKPEYKRLYNWVVAVLNEGNPGLGDLYKTYFPGFPMANKGSMISEPYEGLKIFVETFPPGKFRPGMLPPENLNPAKVDESILRPAPVESDENLPPVKEPALAGFGMGNNLNGIVGAVVVIIILISIGRKS